MEERNISKDRYTFDYDDMLTGNPYDEITDDCIELENLKRQIENGEEL